MFVRALVDYVRLCSKKKKEICSISVRYIIWKNGDKRFWGVNNICFRRGMKNMGNFISIELSVK